MKKINLDKLKNDFPNKVWLRGKIKGENISYDIKIDSISFKKVLGDYCLIANGLTSNSCKPAMLVVALDNLKLSVKLWNRETKKEDNYKVTL